MYNGSIWSALDIDLPGSPQINTILDSSSGLYIGGDFTGTATTNALTTVTNSGTTDGYPLITVIGPTSGSAVLQRIENVTTGEILYFTLTVMAGEVITMDFRPGKKTITSTFRGVISDQPRANSDEATFHLSPGSNTLSCFVTGTTTGAGVVVRLTPAYWSADGIAA